jgi:hypothetical protein
MTLKPVTVTLKPGDVVTVKIVDPKTEEYVRLLQSGWRLRGFQSDGTAILLQPLDPDEERKQ